ncbi:hypothetical protein [Variovorax sp. PAMC26660]|uniref:hypothetical protein n=1 Tax=Variovorax sp. PAMC26660 TaxID=2762322 RepID=UPI00164E2149|nr:hypothetical protein [Variovorax sp. PAMC26660]QNK66077.1 hypothetical protein H7F35_23130 [Variovorax sp. PAMC26660]
MTFYSIPHPTRDDCLLRVSAAKYWWLKAEEERKDLRAYGAAFPLHAFLDRLLCLGVDGEGAEVFAVELRGAEFGDLMASTASANGLDWLPHQADRERAERFARALKPGRRLLAISCGVLMFGARDPITNTTKEPA